jgi:hypothetical protein
MAVESPARMPTNPIVNPRFQKMAAIVINPPDTRGTRHNRHINQIVTAIPVWDAKP